MLRSTEVVLFGSTASDQNSEGSDVDLLCVGHGNRIKTHKLDLMWREPQRINSPGWLGSELAGHIAAFGVWLHGKGEWTANVAPSKASIKYKRKQIEARARCLFLDWDLIRREYRQKHVVKIRRDLQRLLMLQNRNPVPTTPTLDVLWAKQGSPAAFVELVQNTGSKRMVTVRQIRRFAPYLLALHESGLGQL